jgi:hypothetical protein
MKIIYENIAQVRGNLLWVVKNKLKKYIFNYIFILGALVVFLNPTSLNVI